MMFAGTKSTSDIFLLLYLYNNFLIIDIRPLVFL